MRAALALILGLAVGSPGITKELSELSALVKKKSWADAAVRARSVEQRIAARAPLEVLDPQVMAAPADGLGIYTPLPGGVVRGQDLYIYAHVRNHGIRKIAQWHEIDLVSDLILLSEKGEELARDEGFGRSRFNSRVAHRDTFVNIALRVHGLDPGRYRVRLVIHDKVGGKKAQVEAPFQVP